MQTSGIVKLSTLLCVLVRYYRQQTGKMPYRGNVYGRAVVSLFSITFSTPDSEKTGKTPQRGKVYGCTMLLLVSITSSTPEDWQDTISWESLGLHCRIVV